MDGTLAVHIGILKSSVKYDFKKSRCLIESSGHRFARLQTLRSSNFSSIIIQILGGLADHSFILQMLIKHSLVLILKVGTVIALCILAFQWEG